MTFNPIWQESPDKTWSSSLMRIQLVIDQREGRTYFALYIYKKKKNAWLPKFVLKFAENTKIQFLFLFFSPSEIPPRVVVALDDIIEIVKKNPG